MAKLPHTPFATHLSGSAKETELRIRSIFQWDKKRPPAWTMVLVALVILSCGSLVSCYPVQPIAEPDSSSGSSSLSEPPVSSIQQDDRIFETTLEHLTLDGSGTRDDSLHIQSDISSRQQCTLTVRLGTGETLKKTWENVSWLPNVLTAPLIDPDRDAIVLDCAAFGSNYNGATVLVVEVADGQLLERYTDQFTAISGTYAEARPGQALNVLRVPCQVDKWHAPELYTVAWNGTEFTAVGDGFFTDTATLTLDRGHSRSLALKGITEENSYTQGLVYTEIQVFDGDTLVQTVLPDQYLPQQYYEYSGFLASQGVEIADINFDGAEDFGLCCDTTANGIRAWFVWDEGQQQFRYLAHLGGNWALNEQEKQLTVLLYDESTNLSYTEVYTYNSQGQLIQVTDQPLDSSLAATFQAILRGEAAFWDVDSQQSLDISTIRLAFTPEDVPLSATHFAIVDLDDDGQPEIVLEVTTQTSGVGGVVILREQQGAVFGYTLWYRAFNDLKADGTFSFSSSAFSSGFGRLSFQEGGYTIHKIAYSDIQPYNPEQLLYHLDGSSVAESAFNAAILQQDQKPDAVWYPLTDANITNLADLTAICGYPLA